MADDLHARAMLDRIRVALVGADPDPVRVGRFEIVRVLGRGGMGVVYEARDPNLGRLVALKVIEASEAERDRVLQEARALARLQHAAIVGVHEADVDGDRVYIAMELVAGVRLDQWLGQRRPAIAEIVRVFRIAGEALASAHDKQVVHGDFKPHNVLVTDAGEVKVVDFGLARIDRITIRARAGDVAPGLTAAGAGTPGYMAPEQITHLRVDEKSDQFSYCVALFEALSGRKPFFGATAAEVAERTCHGEIDRTALLAIPASLRSVVQRGLARDPAARFASMRALAAELVPARRRWSMAVAALGVLAAGVVTWRIATAGGSSTDGTAGVETRAPMKIDLAQVEPPQPEPPPTAQIEPAKREAPKREGAKPGPQVAGTRLPGKANQPKPSAPVTETTVTPMPELEPRPTRPTAHPPAERSIGYVDDPNSPGMRASVEVMNAGKAEQAGNAETCLRMLDRALEIDPGPEGRIASMTRARCEMRLGRCEDGKRRHAAANGNTAWANQDAARLAEVLCPATGGTLASRVERLRVQARSEKLCPQGHVLAAAEAAFGERATMTAEQIKTLATVFFHLARCNARKLACDEATRARSAYVQLTANASAEDANTAAADWAAVECTDEARRAEADEQRRRDEWSKSNPRL